MARLRGIFRHRFSAPHAQRMARVLLVITILSIASCKQHSGGPPQIPLELPGQFSISGNNTIDALWWVEMKDPQLTPLIEQDIILTSQVKGEVVAISDNFVPGGFIDKGQPLLTIDPTDYELTVLQQSSDVAKAESDLALEMGNQLIARKEFEILGEKASTEEKRLILRGPQLDHKRATLKGAKARLNQAELDLKRTRVNAPFNSVILTRSVNIGSQISATTPLSRLAGTDEFWLKFSVPLSQLQWIEIPGDTSSIGSKVKVRVVENGDSSEYNSAA